MPDSQPTAGRGDTTSARAALEQLWHEWAHTYQAAGVGLAFVAAMLLTIVVRRALLLPEAEFTRPDLRAIMAGMVFLVESMPAGAMAKLRPDGTGGEGLDSAGVLV